MPQELSDGHGKMLDGLMKVSDGLGKMLDGLGKVSDGVGNVLDGHKYTCALGCD